MKLVPKSQGDVYVDLYAKLFSDLKTLYPDKVALLCQDFRTLQSRVQAEGLSFATTTLPLLGKAVDQSLESGVFQCPREFKRARLATAIPAFLQGMLEHAYDPDGRLVGWDPGKLRAVRTVCYLLYKLEVPYPPSVERAALEAFVKTEEEMVDYRVPAESRVLGLAQAICGDVFLGFDPKNIVPRHGPGAVATGESGEEKWRFARRYDSIHQLYPYYEYFIVSGDHLLDTIRMYRELKRVSAGVAKVVLVPKDSRGPRIISEEPLEYQWIQQGYMRALVPFLEETSVTRGQVNFTDQTVNQQLAISSSMTKEYATLDLKDASDRVPNSLVEFLIPPGVVRSLQAIRTPATTLPDGRVLQLRKFAAMGSAVCFPIEAVVFWSLAVAAISVKEGRYYGELANRVFVYGDDIIVPSEHVDAVVEALEAGNLRVNRNKSFVDGDFRESCGVDAYKGSNVTPTRIRTPWSENPSDGSVYESWIAYSNHLRDGGFHYASDYMIDQVERVWGKVPHGVATSGFPCRIEKSYVLALCLNDDKRIRLRFNTELHRAEAKVLVLRTKTVPSVLDGWSRCLRNLVSPVHGSDPSWVTVRRAVSLKRAWRPL